MTRLEILCKLHKQQGGTIHDFNRAYNIDFLSLDKDEFKLVLRYIKMKQSNYGSQK